jgi:ankyrin repeat protein
LKSLSKTFLLALMVLFLWGCSHSTAKTTLNLAKLYPNLQEIDLALKFCDQCNLDGACSKKQECSEQPKLVRSVVNSFFSRANLDAVKYFIEKRNLSVDFGLDDNGETPLMMTAYYSSNQHFKMANYLIEHGADIDLLQKSGKRSAINTAVWKKNYKVAILLLAHGAKEEYTCEMAVPLMHLENPNKLLQSEFFEIMPYMKGCCEFISNKYYKEFKTNPLYQPEKFAQACPTPETYKDPKEELKRLLAEIVP